MKKLITIVALTLLLVTPARADNEALIIGGLLGAVLGGVMTNNDPIIVTHLSSKVAFVRTMQFKRLLQLLDGLSRNLNTLTYNNNDMAKRCLSIFAIRHLMLVIGTRK